MSALREPATPVRVDHLVYAAPDLSAAIDRLVEQLGVRAAAGGRHPGRGTRNALIALGPASYLEIVGPDPEQPRPETPRWFGIDELGAPRLAGWFTPRQDLESIVAQARLRGIPLGAVLPGSRRREDGTLLSWRFTDPAVALAGGVVPWFIDWGGSPHPARSAAEGVRLAALRAEHPDPKSVRRILSALGVELEVREGSAPALVAAIESTRGLVELR